MAMCSLVMKQAYDLLKWAAAFIESDDAGDMTIAHLAKEVDVADPTLRRLMDPDIKHKTLDMLGRLEPVMHDLDPDGKHRPKPK